MPGSKEIKEWGSPIVQDAPPPSPSDLFRPHTPPSEKEENAVPPHAPEAIQRHGLGGTFLTRCLKRTAPEMSLAALMACNSRCEGPATGSCPPPPAWLVDDGVMGDSVSCTSGRSRPYLPGFGGAAHGRLGSRKGPHTESAAPGAGHGRLGWAVRPVRPVMEDGLQGLDFRG